MKQGTANSNTFAPKREPNSHAVNPAGVSQLGNMVGTQQAKTELYRGRGFEAPAPKGDDRHKSGSQGRY